MMRKSYLLRDEEVPKKGSPKNEEVLTNHEVLPDEEVLPSSSVSRGVDEDQEVGGCRSQAGRGEVDELQGDKMGGQ